MDTSYHVSNWSTNQETVYNIQVKIYIPDGFTKNGIDCFVLPECSWGYNSLYFYVDISSLDYGESADFMVTATTNNVPGNYTINAVIDTHQNDINPTDNSVDLPIIVNNPAAISISSPVDGDIFEPGDVVSFNATAVDPEDGDLSDSIQWTSSIDGLIGTGSLVQENLSVGVHDIAASVTDSNGEVSTVQINVRVSEIPADAMIINTVIGNGIAGFSGDGGPALDAMLDTPAAGAVDTDGNIYFADKANNRVRKVSTDGVISTIAGGGTYQISNIYAYTATSVALDSPEKVAVTPDGQIFVYERSTGRIHVIDTNGDILWVAGLSGDFYPTLTIMDMAADAAGNLYVASYSGNRIYKVDTFFSVSVFAGTGTTGSVSDGTLAINSRLNQPTGIAVDAQGNIYYSELNDHRIRKIDTSGYVYTIAGSNEYDPDPGFSGDGGLAVDAVFRNPRGLAIDADGNIFICDSNNYRIRQIDTSGIIRTVAGNGISAAPDDYEIATETSIEWIPDISVGPQGNLILFAMNEHHIHEMRKVDQNAIPIVTITTPVDGASISVDEGPIDFVATAYDTEDGDIGDSIQWVSSLDGAFISPGTLSVGSHTITASAVDSGWLKGSDVIVLSVTPHINVAPTIDITNPIDGSIYAEDDGPLSFTAAAQDPEDGDLSSSVVWSSDIDGSFASPVALSAGTHTITAEVTDSGGLSVMDSIVVTITAHVNIAPTISIAFPADGSTYSEDDGSLAFTATATDLEDGELSGSVVWSSDVDGTFTSPAALTVGTHNITAQVTDSGGLSATDSIAVTITAHVNTAPTIIIVFPVDGSTYSEDDGALAFSATAQDLEDGNLAESILWTSDIDGDFTSPATLSLGTHNIAASVTDSGGLGTSDSIVLTITAHVNQAPTVSILTPVDGNAYSENDIVSSFSATAQDLEEGDITAGIEWFSDIDGPFTPPAALSLGQHVITAQASDSAGLTGSDSVTIDVVTNIDYFEITSIPSPQYPMEPFSITVTARDSQGALVENFSGTAQIAGLAQGATGGSSEYVVGDGTSSWSFPMYTYYHDARTQVIYTADELGCAATINAIALDVTSLPGQTMNNWTIRMKHTSLDYYATYAWESGWTVVYQNNETVNSTGWVVFNFSTPFSYNGTDNLMIDFSFNNSSWTSHGNCGYTRKNQIRTLYFNTDSGYGDPLSWNGTSSPAPRTSYYVPNLKIFSIGGLSVSPETTGTFINGVWTGDITIDGEATGVQIELSDTDGHIGTSNIFDVTILDQDGDGLADAIETDPSSCTAVDNPDTDSDGLADGMEDINHNGMVDAGETDPCLFDTDADGLGDADEDTYGTDPIAADTDGDDIIDGDEISVYGTFPDVADTDGDGLDDGDEVAFWDVAWSEDADNDGLINLLDSDSDNDGINDGYEVDKGSDPDDPASVPDLCANSAADTVSVFPYIEDFETGWGNWVNVTEDMFNWTRYSGSTGSIGTGPTTALEGTYYIYTEASSPNYPSKTAIVEGPRFDLTNTSQAELAFWYHMYGAAMGTLSVQVSTDGCNNWETVWSLTGDQGNVWKEAIVDLSAYSDQQITIRFYAVTGSSYTSDISVDNIMVDAVAAIPCDDDADCDDNVYCNGLEYCDGQICQPGIDPCIGLSCNETLQICEEFQCSIDTECDDNNACTVDTCNDSDCSNAYLNLVTAFPYSEGFESGWGTWTNVTGDMMDWTRKSGSTSSSSTGPTSAYEGNYYIYTEASSPNYPSKTAILEGPQFDLRNAGSAQLTFKYHMYGSAMGTLSVEISNDCQNWTTVWILSGNQGNLWSEANIDLSSLCGQVVAIRFYGTTGTSYTSDIAIDDVWVTVD